jgi:hypothetical protein
LRYTFNIRITGHGSRDTGHEHRWRSSRSKRAGTEKHRGGRHFRGGKAIWETAWWWLGSGVLRTRPAHATPGA